MNIPVTRLREQAFAALEGNDAERAWQLASNLASADSDNYESHQLAGATALDALHPVEAIRHFTAASRLTRRSDLGAAAFTGIGRGHLLLEDAQQAEAAFRRALSLAVDFPPALAGLAEALGQQGRHEEAEQAARRALDLGMEVTSVHLALTHALMGMDRLDEAEASLARARALEPEHPAVRFAAGGLAKFRGRLDEAKKIYSEVLEQFPDYPGYGQLAALQTYGAEDPELDILEQRLARLPGDGELAARVDLHFALAKMYDDAGLPDKAAPHLRAANDLERDRMRYDVEAAEKRMQHFTEMFTREHITRLGEEAGMRNLQPIFVVSLPRSGSTLTEQMLASHSQIRGGGELRHFSHVATALGYRWGERSDFPDIDPADARNDLREAAREYASQTAPLRLAHPRFTDKSLGNFFYIGLIRMMLPDAHIVYVRRHPLATAFGLYRQQMGRGTGYSSDLHQIARYYRAHATLMEHWRKTIPEAFIEVQYEALVCEPERELRRIFDYLGLEFEPRTLEYYRLDRPVRTMSLAQVREPLNRRGLTRHEQYGELLQPVATELAEEIAAYEAELAAAGIDLHADSD